MKGCQIDTDERPPSTCRSGCPLRRGGGFLFNMSQAMGRDSCAGCLVEPLVWLVLRIDSVGCPTQDYYLTEWAVLQKALMWKGTVARLRGLL